jgi:D-alanyl-D-alanine carboxypeptidase
MGNHNRLLGEYGIDGLKTGYTRASGFNLLTSARSEDRHIVVAAFGFATSSARDAKVRELVQRYRGNGRRGTYLASALIAEPSGAVGYANWVNNPVTPMPRIRGRGIEDHFTGVPIPLDPNSAIAAVQVASLDTPTAGTPIPLDRPLSLLPVENPITTANVAAPQPQTLDPQPLPQAMTLTVPAQPSGPADVIGQWLNEAINFGPDARLGGNAAGQSTEIGGPLPPAPIAGAGQSIDLMTSGAIGELAEGDADIWVVQIGATPTPDAAQALLWQATGNVAVLVDFRSYIEQIELAGQTLYRARFAGFGGRDQAMAACNELTRSGMSCLAMPG